MFGYRIALLLAATIILPCITGVIRFKRLSVSYKIITALLLVALLTEMVMILFPYFGVDNLIGMHLYSIVEIVLLGLFFTSQIKNDSRARYIILILTFLLSAFALGYALLGNNIAEFNSIPRALECVYFSAISCYVFYLMSMEGEARQSEDNCFYFINGAILFYFSSSFLVFALSKFMAADNDTLLAMYNVHSIVNGICNIAYAVGLWIASRSSYLVV